MRNYIFTPYEREIVKQYVEKGEKLNGLSILLHRVRGAKQLREDAQLLSKLKPKEAN